MREDSGDGGRIMPNEHHHVVPFVVDDLSNCPKELFKNNLGPIPEPRLGSRRCRRIADGQRPGNCRPSFPNAQEGAARGSSRSDFLRLPNGGRVVRRGDGVGLRPYAGRGGYSRSVGQEWLWGDRSSLCPNRDAACVVRTTWDAVAESLAAWHATTWRRERWHRQLRCPAARRDNP